MSDPRWSFVVDTDMYAGNFERELGGYVVGQVDDYGDHRAGPYIELYEKECPTNPFENLVEWRVYDPGDDGIMRVPANISPTPGTKGGAYNSVSIHLGKKPTSKQLRLLVERAKAFPSLPRLKKWDSRPTILRCRLVLEETVETSEDVG